MPKTEFPEPPEIESQNKYMIVAPYAPPEDPGMDLVDVVVAAWKNRLLLVVSWIVLTVATFSVLSSINKLTASTVLKSGQANGAIQTQDQIRNDITEIIFPSVKLAMEKAQQHALPAVVTVEIPKNSELLNVSISSAGLSEGDLTALLDQVTQTWSKEQLTKLKAQEKLTQDRIALIEAEIVSINKYVKGLNSPTEPLQQTEADRLRLRIDTQTQTIFNLNSTMATFEPPLIRKPFELKGWGMANAIKLAGISLLIGAVLSCGVVLMASIIRSARLRLQNS